MANAFSTNYPIPSSSNTFSLIWRLTRTMKAAGWTYKASSNGSQVDLSGNSSNDLWGNNATPLNDTYSNINTTTSGTLSLPASGSTLNVSSTSGFNLSSGTINVQTSANGWQQLTYTGTTGSSFTGVSGGTGNVPNNAEVSPGSTFSLEQISSWICLSGPQTLKIALNSLPTGTPVRGEIVTQGTTSATGELLGFVWDPVGTSGWAVIGPQSAPAGTTITSGSNGQALPQSTINVASTSGFASSGMIYVTTSTGTAVVYYTGTSGGNSFTGCTTPSGFTGTMSTGNGVFGSSIQFDGTHTFTGGISSAVLTPLGTTVTSGSNTVNVNTFTGSGTLNATSTVGFPTVGMLYVNTGSGTAQISYTNTTGTTFTGCATALVSSGTPFSGTLSTGGTIQAAPVYYNREFIFGKPSSSVVNGNIYYICADYVNENAVMYSTLATAAGATASVWPGGGGTNNGFNINSPVTGNPLSFCFRGTGGSTSGSDSWIFGNSSSIYGSTSQIVTANNIPGAGITADGTFWIAASVTTPNFMTGIVFGRLDDIEPGDLDPYAFIGGNTSSIYSSFTRSTATGLLSTSNSGASFQESYYFNNGGGSANPAALAYQSRGNTVISKDIAYCFQFSPMYSTVSSSFYLAANTTPVRLVCHPATTTPLVREPVTLTSPASQSGTFKQVKGRMRWFMTFGVGNCLDTFDSKLWLCVTAFTTSGTSIPAFALGPYDGSTTPIP